jgi:hypothetical protein
MYKLAADRRPKVARPKVSFAQNQTEADDLHATFKPIKINYSYFNYTGGDITIVDRSNMKFTIRPVASGGTRFGHGIMVVKNYVFPTQLLLTRSPYPMNCRKINRCCVKRLLIADVFHRTNLL